jgi:hypothetical protein
VTVAARPGGPEQADVRDVERRRMVDLLTAAVAIGGYACCAVFLIVGFSDGQWPFPGGDVVVFYAPAGDALRAGGEVYFPGFLYGPPWAVAFGAVSWLGPGAIHAAILALDAIALWTIAWGDWRRLGFILWFPLIPFEIAAGQLNLIIAAAIVAAQHGIVWPLAAVSLAKVWPAVALPPRYWRRFLVAILAFSLVSLPWLHLWPQWVAALIDTTSHPFGPVIPVPWIARAGVAAVLLLLQRPWTRALAAAIVSPGLYWGQLVVLVAPFSLWLAERFPSGRTAQSPRADSPRADSPRPA